MSRIAPLLLLVLALPALADEAPPAGPLDLTTQRVVVFKDGYGLFVKRATGVADADGVVYTEDVPDAAVLGTFWAVAEDDALVAMRAEWIEEEVQEEAVVPCASVAELLRANVGRKVALGLGEQPRVVGTVLEVLPSLVVVQVGEERLALPIAAVQRVEGTDLATTRTAKQKTTERRKRLSFLLGRERAGRETALTLFYFRPGIRWIPAYRLGGTWEGEATLALQAEVINDAEDLAGVPLHLVVGVPNFRFRDVVSPLVLEGALLGAMGAGAADPQLAAQLMSQNVFSNRFVAEEASPRATGGAMDLAPELAGAGVQDLFVYEAQPVRLPRGARATVPLWRAEVPVRHLYTLDVKAERDAQGNLARSSSRRPIERREAPGHLARNDVWHQLELENGATAPWTTGAALLLQGAKPVAQEILGYTAPGATALLPITVATDLRAEAVEVEVDREPNAIRWAGYTWAEVTVEGTIEAHSFRSEVSRMRIRAALTGTAEEAEGGTLQVRSGAGGVNPESLLTWSFDLPAGETRTLTYRYSFYTR
jgi:hypothetical protein